MRMKRMDRSEDIDLREWKFSDATGVEALLMRGFACLANDVLREQFEEDPPWLTLPSGLDGEDDDGAPLMIHLVLPLTEQGGNGVTYACLLDELIDEVIESYESPDGSQYVGNDEKGREACGKIVVRLHELAEKLDAACRERR
jgi:hypothetical protein